MTDPNHIEITLYLTDIHDLFNAPEFDPFTDQDYTSSGVEQIITELKPESLNRPIHTTIFLPPDALAESTDQVIGAAIRRYCGARIYEAENELASLRWRGLKALQIGLIFLAVCLLLSALFGSLMALPPFLQTFLGEGFLIAGWVGLWHPIELLLYEWWPHWRTKRLYERIQEMKITIRAEE